MKRKTNLFYTEGPDSKFITFSNYTECLTGNFLSLETKLFPDKFLCLKINNLNATTKPKFIKFLAAYYENKLAVLRDRNIELNVNIESNILPLSYLLEGIMCACDLNADIENEWSISESKIDSYLNGTCINAKDNDWADRTLDTLITYVGEITEQDYNGTYTDTICYIDLNAYNEGEIIIKETSSSEVINSVTVEDTKLHGWENDNVTFEGYDVVKPIFDAENTYYYHTSLSKIKLNEISDNINSDKLGKTLSFNIIIPLFSLVNKNISHDNWSIYQIDEASQYKYIDLQESSLNVGNKYIYDVPLGMWINGDEETDSFIELKKDTSLNIYPSWSLLISSQFKPFPYSNKLTEVNETGSSILNGHATYAEVLCRMNSLFDEFLKISSSIYKLEERIRLLESNVNNIATENNISDMNEKMISTEQRILDELNNMKSEFYGYIENIKWSSAG